VSTPPGSTDRTPSGRPASSKTSASAATARGAIDTATDVVDGADRAQRDPVARASAPAAVAPSTETIPATPARHDRAMTGKQTLPQDRSRQALHDYYAGLRRRRIAYAAILAALVIVAAVLVKLAYAHGEISHATLSTAPAPAASVPLDTPPATLRTAWSRSEHTAIGTPYRGGTVITYSRHAVVGRDALTGKVRWSYTRTDRTACTAAQLGGVTIAVFAQHGNCDELTGLDSGTGARRWSRTLDENVHPINGRPHFAAGHDTFLVSNSTVIYAISPEGTQGADNGGLDRWLFSQSGCTINSVVLGSAGALISQRCRHPDCSNRKFCGAGTQLLLRDATAGEDDDNSTNKNNPDQIIWNKIGDRMRPMSADDVITATRRGSSRLAVLAAKNGKSQGSLPLGTPARSETGALQLSNAELIRAAGITYAVNAAGTRYLWKEHTAALPTSATADALSVGRRTTQLAVPSADGVALLKSADGTVWHEYPVGAARPGSRAYRFGTGFVIAGPRTTVYQ
jgi:hypothetical protein